LPLEAVHLNTLPGITGRNAGATDRGLGARFASAAAGRFCRAWARIRTV